jgi:hypothetical protein
MPVSSLFEVGARILRRHARILVAIALVIQLPGAILDAVAQQRLGSAVRPLLVDLDTETPRLLTPTDAQTESILGALLLVGAAMLVSMFLGAIATVAYAFVVRQDYHGERSTFADSLTLALRRAFAAVAAAILAALAVVAAVVVAVGLAVLAIVVLPGAAGEPGGIGVFIALVLGVAGALLTVTLLVRLSLAVVAVAIEGIGPVRAIRRSWHLTGDNTWRTLAVLVILAFIISILASLLVQLASVVTGTSATGEVSVSALDALIAAGVSVLFAPVAVVVQTVLYFDLRVRRDAWDLPAPPMVGLDVDSGEHDGVPDPR